MTEPLTAEQAVNAMRARAADWIADPNATGPYPLPSWISELLVRVPAAGSAPAPSALTEPSADLIRAVEVGIGLSDGWDEPESEPTRKMQKLARSALVAAAQHLAASVPAVPSAQPEWWIVVGAGPVDLFGSAESAQAWVDQQGCGEVVPLFPAPPAVPSALDALRAALVDRIERIHGIALTDGRGARDNLAVDLIMEIAADALASVPVPALDEALSVIEEMRVYVEHDRNPAACEHDGSDGHCCGIGAGVKRGLDKLTAALAAAAPSGSAPERGRNEDGV